MCKFIVTPRRDQNIEKERGNAFEQAALLLVPYLCWVTFAGVLNLAMWRLNPSLSQSQGSV
jgi:hypothetical protein